jgi:phage terminase large subunit-like protein
MPTPQGGGLVRAAWLTSYAPNERPEKFDRIVRSWDTANKATELSDFSVCTSWGSRARTFIFYFSYRKFAHRHLPLSGGSCSRLKERGL